MKKLTKVILIIFGIITVLIAALNLFLVWASKQPAVQEKYYESTVTDKPLEQKYTNKGIYNVSYIEYDAGNEKDAGIAPLWSLQENYNALPDDIMKIYARRVNTDHGNMLANADGYMTAWFMYHLQGDEEAGSIFLGDAAEILNNANRQDVEKNR